MPRFFTLLLSLFFFAKTSFAQTTYTWIGGAVGDYQDANNWSPVRLTPAITDVLAFDVTTPVSVANVPNQTIGAVRILSGTSSVTFGTNLVTNVLSINAATPLVYTTGGSIIVGDLLTVSLTNTAAFNINSGAFGIAPSTGGKVSIFSDLILDGGKLDFDVAGTGGAVIESGGSITYTSGIFLSANEGSVVWRANSNYYHNISGASASAIPVSLWETNATCSITGMNAGAVIAPTGFTNVIFYNLVWNCTAQTANADLDFLGNSVTINGSLSINSTGSGAVRFSGLSNTITVSKQYTQTNGTLVLQTGSSDRILLVKDVFNHTGGSIDFVGGSGSGSATVNVAANLTKGPSSVWSSTSTDPASKMKLQFSGVLPLQTVDIAGTWNAPNQGTCNIINTNTDQTGVIVTGTLQVINTNSVTAATCDNGGNFSGTGSINYVGAGSGGTTLIYSGGRVQTASAIEFPSSNGPVNLTLNTSVFVSFPASSFNRTITGTFTMVQGALNIGSANVLSLTGPLGSQLAYTGGFITSGTLSRRFPAGGLPTAASSNSLYPFGTGANNRSINFYFSAATVTTGGDIAISHTPDPDPVAIGPFPDNGVTLDKRSKSAWLINTGTLALGATTIAITARADNIGSVNDFNTLRLTDGVTSDLGSLIPTTGPNETPVVGKSALTLADVSGKNFYIGSDIVNPLQIVTFTWNGSVSTAWTTAANWTPSVGAAGYPSASTEVAIINPGPVNMPAITAGNISVFQLKINGSGASLTLTGTAGIAVYDQFTFLSGSAINLSVGSTFTYASSNTVSQNIYDLPYGNLAVSGSAPKILPATTTIRGNFTISGAAPTFGTGTFVYDAGSLSQTIAQADYYNLSFTGNRGGGTIKLGSGTANNTINVFGTFSMAATNYSATVDPYNTFNFASAGSQTVPGFTYGSITSTGGGPRIFDPLGSTDPTHVIVTKSLSFSPVTPTITNSKVKLLRNLQPSNTGLSGSSFWDFEIAGNHGGKQIYIADGQTLSIAGTFSISATNFTLNPTNNTIVFNGTGAQTIPGFKPDVATNTPAWRYNKINITHPASPVSPRQITLDGNAGDTINIIQRLVVSSNLTFVVAGSTVNFTEGSDDIPRLGGLGVVHYNNIVITGGTRILGNTINMSGNLSVIGKDGSLATLNVGNNTGNRTLTIGGNLTITGTSASSSALTSVVDFNAGNFSSKIQLAGNLTVSGNSQLLTGNDPQNVKGVLVFNGINQQYSNTALFKNKYVNYEVGSGTSATTLKLNSNIDLTRSSVIPLSDTFTVRSNASLNADTYNIRVGLDTLPVAGLYGPQFILISTATLITANTGISPNFAIEGTATDGSTGTIAATDILKTYSNNASYVLNGATVNPFPAAILTMNKLTIGANVSLNRKPIDVNGTLDLASYTLTQAGNDLEFNGLASTTGSIFADKNASLTIRGSIDTVVGSLRFVLPGGNITGQFNLNKGVTVPLASDLIIDKTPLTGNFITGAAASVLDINGNTLTINGAVSGPGFLAGSNTSNLTIGTAAAAGTLKFLAGKQVLKDFKLVNNSTTAILGTALDITGGTGPGTEGVVSVSGTGSVLSTGGFLTLKSSALGTARVDQGRSAGGYISGDVTVERYLSSNRSWRFLSAPTFGQTIHEAWQENQPAGVNLSPGIGTNITSNRATWAADGFDFQTPGNSLLIYNSLTNVWDGAPNTSSQISVTSGNKSYMLFLRGDRSVTPAVGAPSTTAVVRTKGNLFQGNLPSISVAPDQYAAVGNNYAAAIDFTTLSKLNIDQSFTLWDPYIPGAKNLGAWVTFSAATGWLPSIPGGSYLNVANTRIESGQAFMVHNSSGSTGTVTLLESSKLTGSKLVSRPLGIARAKQMLTTQLYNINGGTSNIADGNFVVFSEAYSNVIDDWDAVKINNFGDNFGVLRNNQTLVVDARQPVVETDTIFFNMKKVKLQPYRLEFIAKDFDANLTAFLEDTYLQRTTVMNMAGTTAYDFSVTSETASAAANRFRIVFKITAPLPVTFTNIAATEKTNGIEIEWEVENEINIASYDVERSIDGKNFTKMYNAIATASTTGGTANYNWLDTKTNPGDNFYRIKSIGKDEKIAYSKIVKVTASKIKTGFIVYPNPVADGMIGLQMKNIPPGVYTIKIINSDGQVLGKEIIKHTGGNSTQTITSASQLVSGSYQLEITGGDKKVNILRLVVL